MSESWPENLDALQASSEHHTLLFENEHVRVLRTRIPAGERTAVHTHRWPGVLQVLSWSPVVRYDDRGAVMADLRHLDDVAPESAFQWIDALPPHTLENVGGRDIVTLTVEIKGATDGGAA